VNLAVVIVLNIWGVVFVGDVVMVNVGIKIRLNLIRRANTHERHRINAFQ
jgi:hypothetical protein